MVIEGKVYFGLRWVIKANPLFRMWKNGQPSLQIIIAYFLEILAIGHKFICNIFALFFIYFYALIFVQVALASLQPNGLFVFGFFFSKDLHKCLERRQEILMITTLPQYGGFKVLYVKFSSLQNNELSTLVGTRHLWTVGIGFGMKDNNT